MGILVLAANTSFADFPRLSSLLARDGFMPSRFAFRGERLAFSTGIVALAVLSIVVLAAFRGRVEALIPLYAIGVFTSITLSQAGMVVHWWRERGRRLAAKHRHQRRRRGRDRHRRGDLRDRQVRARRLAHRHHHPAAGWRDAVHRPPVPAPPARDRGPPGERHRSAARHQRVIVPAADVTRDVVQAIRFGRTMSDDVTAVHVTDDLETGEQIRAVSSASFPASRWSSSSPPTARSFPPLVRFLEAAAEGSGERRHRGPPSRVRVPSLVGALPVQRERPADRAGAARSLQRPRRGGSFRREV